MRLTDRLQTVLDDPEVDPDPADIFHDALGSILNDDVRDQHGLPTATILYESKKYGTLKLKVANPDDTEWTLFAHYLWNAGVKMAVLVGQEDERFQGQTDQGNTDTKGWQWKVEGEKVLELGSGVGLPGMIAALAGAEEVTLSDYPSSNTITNLGHNVAANIPRQLRNRISISPHVWGDFFTSPRSPFGIHNNTQLSMRNPHRYTRIIAADTYWITSQHAHLARSMLHFLSYDQKARVLMVAGFHTGRRIITRWFETATEEGLKVEEVWEEDGDGLMREWVADREESFEEGKKWLVLAVLKR